MKTCPHCGSAIRSVPADIVDAIEAVRLPRKERQIVEELLDAYPRYTRNSALEGRLYDDERYDSPMTDTIHSHVSKLRTKLKVIGVSIECPRFVGYRLVLPPAGIDGNSLASLLPARGSRPDKSTPPRAAVSSANGETK